jgi:hypothetical protein
MWRRWRWWRRTEAAAEEEDEEAVEKAAEAAVEEMTAAEFAVALPILLLFSPLIYSPSSLFPVYSLKSFRACFPTLLQRLSQHLLGLLKVLHNF